MVIVEKDIGVSAFICFGSEDKNDREYGPSCARRAIEVLNGATNIAGIELPEKKTFVVREALSKEQREIEKQLDMIKYKSSKKRCNLYIRGFSRNISVETLQALFSPFGDIESIKLYPQRNEASQEPHEYKYGFVCFEKPDAALAAKQ